MPSSRTRSRTPDRDSTEEKAAGDVPVMRAKKVKPSSSTAGLPPLEPAAQQELHRIAEEQLGAGGFPDLPDTADKSAVESKEEHRWSSSTALRPRLTPQQELEVAMAAGAFAADETAVTPWSGSSLAVAPVRAALPPTDMFHALAHELGCTNIYIKDVDFGHRDVTAKFSVKRLDNEFVQLNVRPFLTAQFMSERMFGTTVLFPAMVVSDCYMPPHGNIDELPDPTDSTRNDYLLDKGKLEDASIKMSFRPSAWNRFHQSPDGGYDQLAHNALGYIHSVFELKARAAMEAAGYGAETWSTCVTAKKDLTSHGLHTKVSIMRSLNKDDPADRPLMMQLKDRSYKAPTKLLTDICLRKAHVVKPFVAYRVTSARERREDKDCPLYRPLTYEQMTVDIKGHIVMPLVSLGGLRKKSAYHVTTNLRSYVWLGDPKEYGPMKEATMQELLRYVPDYPAAPTAAELWDRPEREEQITQWQAELADFVKKRERGEV